jgi:prepilin-type N-terminal cleavage/methylation domain-containing protein
MPPPASSPEAGFSLTEVLTSVAILAILSLTAMPVFSDIQQQYNLRGAARRIYSNMQRARIAAVVRNARHRAQVNSDGLVYLQEYDIVTGQWQDLSASALPNDTPGIYVTGASQVVFSPDGTALDPAVLTVLNSTGMQKRILINRSGSIEIL